MGTDDQDLQDTCDRSDKSKRNWESAIRGLLYSGKRRNYCRARRHSGDSPCLYLCGRGLDSVKRPADGTSPSLQGCAVAWTVPFN
jgi:hypothetical protein